MKFGDLKIPEIKIEPAKLNRDLQWQLFLQYSSIIKDTDAGRKVMEVLNDDPRVIKLSGKLISRGSGGHQFKIDTLGMWFLFCVKQYGQEIAERYLDKFLDSESIEVVNELWISGVEVKTAIVLDDDYLIKPIHEILASIDGEYLSRRTFGIGRGMMSPRCAITKVCNVTKAWGNEPPKSLANRDNFQNVSTRLHEIALILNAVEGISCLPYFSTSHPELTTPMGVFGDTGGGSQLYDVVGDKLVELSVESKTTIDALVAAYDKQGSQEKERIKRILGRLSQAKRRIQIEDKMLDLGIALEMLLIDDNDKNDQLSLSFRLRGSWFVGDTAEDRENKYQLLKDIYSYRSEVAHSGVLKGKSLQNITESYPEYELLAENICRKMIIEGKPDWDKLLLNVK